jgi:hypothetical protein
MTAPSESVYRAARRAFIAACEAAQVDSIARLHPARDKDGMPLFMDCAALGPRLAPRAVLAIAADAGGSAIMTRALKELAPLPEDTRLVLVHALDPAAFAGVPADPAWPAAMLKAVATEDLSRVKVLGVLPLGAGSLPALPPLPSAKVALLPPATDSADVAAALAIIFGN